MTMCHAFTPSSLQLVHDYASRKNIRYPQNLFRELIMDDNEDLRTEIAVINKMDGLEKFLKKDDRLCVIKLHAPYCKACRAFGVKFRKLAMEKGDRMNTAGETVHSGDARFGEIDYASNVKLCKNLGISKFPMVLIYQGGRRGSKQRLSEIVCKQNAIEDIVAELDQLTSLSGRK
eukprot:CAMPEP_0172573540 /NCGR_PEP_ID=MMETSP1067-20121228/136243_1 /TAXON_ID=265564 ORGANISM="Thalassiosira punctigera, Strain Tpunct2005C2" /NCGR_SAMPLE_ID=MMETSP1067 /ASSEMBLY_ACC=CAM_ASM_000444 /LENGTH=174 /DNA_ID=CAMNT_0013366147 /DNA_START=428 /DNA_END=952 /DNA_ORIENTATION=+